VKQIVLFSGGASSAYTAKLVIDKYGKENTILLHTPTYAEDEDTERFRQEVAKYLGLPITIQEDGRDLWTLIEDSNCLPSMFIPFCTQQLKIRQTDKFLKSMTEDVNIHYGFGIDEYRRIQKVKTRLEVKGYKTEFLVYKSGLPNFHIKNIIQEDWKIELPQSYKYLEHANCIPCFKGGKGHFKQVCKYYPEQFEKAVQMEHKIGHTVFKDCTLEDIREEVMQSKNQITFLDNDFNIPCECWD
jgi:hypothetical protein